MIRPDTVLPAVLLLVTALIDHTFGGSSASYIADGALPRPTASRAPRGAAMRR